MASSELAMMTGPRSLQAMPFNRALRAADSVTHDMRKGGAPESASCLPSLIPRMTAIMGCITNRNRMGPLVIRVTNS